VTQALAVAITATQARLAAGIAEAEAELIVARKRCRELRETIALARAREAAATTAPPREPKVREVRQQARIAQLTDSILSSAPTGRAIPRRWLPALVTILRPDLERLPQAFAKNAILHWSGEGPLAGLHLGSAKAVDVAMSIARRIQPGSIRVEELTGADENLDVLARVTFTPDGSGRRALETLIHGVFRFDDAGLIALLYLTPYDPDAVNEVLG
jgi:hypothetical protein